jgi:hypothetical protein
MNDITQLSTLYSNAIARAEKAEDILSGLSSYLGVGLGDDETTTAEDFDKRIRWGIDNHTNGTIRFCASIIERLSQKPSTTWGEVKEELLNLIQDADPGTPPPPVRETP